VEPDVQSKRIYDPVDEDDGYRVFVDHVWPRGVSRERAELDEWARELAPSDALRRWFDHVPERFPEFRKRYRAELAGRLQALDALRARGRRARVTILFAARDRDHNNGVVLAEALRDDALEALREDAPSDAAR
jgi:uncharacterized protein YeaO (DUF488 family)